MVNRDNDFEEKRPRPLQVGDQFFYEGKNGVRYFSLEVKGTSDGSVFPMTCTAPACNILPVECDRDGNVMFIYMITQMGRPEVGDASVLKSAGSFCAVAETGVECALRSLRDKLGMKGKVEDLIFTGTSYGFGPQFQFPIELFVIKEYEIDTTVSLLPGCERIKMSIDDIAQTQARRGFFNSETVDLVATVLLRNHNREAFSW